MADRFNLQAQLEHLQLKYAGTGHPDISMHEWLTQQHRDTLASLAQHHHLLMYLSIAQNEPIERVRYKLLQKMVLPCGLPDPKPKISKEQVEAMKKNPRKREV